MADEADKRVIARASTVRSGGRSGKNSRFKDAEFVLLMPIVSSVAVPGGYRLVQRQEANRLESNEPSRLDKSVHGPGRLLF